MPTSKSARFVSWRRRPFLPPFFVRKILYFSKAIAHKKCSYSDYAADGASTPLCLHQKKSTRGFRKGHHDKREQQRSRGVLLRSSSEEEKFVPIDYDSENCPGETAEGRFGPDAILLVGFTPTEKRVVREMLNDMGADFIDLITCTKEMYEKMTLKECMEEKQEGKEVFSVAGMKTKIVIMSGMIGAEVVSVVDAFHESQFKDSAPAFACAVPNSWEKPIKQTVEEISGDHEEAMKDRGSAR